MRQVIHPHESRDLRPRALELLQEKYGVGTAGVKLEVLGAEGVWLASLDLPTGSKSLVIKTVTPQLFSGGVEALYRLHCQLRSASKFLHETTVRFIDFDADRSLLVLEHVPGPSLADLMTRVLAKQASESRVPPLLHLLAEFLVHLHSYEPGELGIQPRPVTNRSFYQDYQERLQESPIARWLPRRQRAPGFLSSYISDESLESSHQRVSFVDLQPKNVLVRGPESIVVIDINYHVVSPSTSVAVLLINIDLAGLRQLTRRAFRLAQDWKRTFLQSYMSVPAADDQNVLRDLRLFYPIAILDLFEQHLLRRRRSKLYLAWFYGLMLRRVLGEIERGNGESAPDIGIRGPGG